MAANKWIDITATISDGMVRWPTDAPVSIHRTEEIGVNGGLANVTAISSTAHLGTHVDAPLHFYKSGTDTSLIPLDLLVGPAKVFRIWNNTSITYDEIKNFTIAKNDRVLFRTRNSDSEWEHAPFMENYIYLGTDAAKYLADKGVLCVGIDYLSIGGPGNNEEVHKLLLGKKIVIIEGLKLGNIADGEYEMVCLPLKIKGSDGAPARVIIKKH